MLPLLPRFQTCCTHLEVCPEVRIFRSSVIPLFRSPSLDGQTGSRSPVSMRNQRSQRRCIQGLSAPDLEISVLLLHLLSIDDRRRCCRVFRCWRYCATCCCCCAGCGFCCGALCRCHSWERCCFTGPCLVSCGPLVFPFLFLLFPWVLLLGPCRGRDVHSDNGHCTDSECQQHSLQGIGLYSQHCIFSLC